LSEAKALVSAKKAELYKMRKEVQRLEEMDNINDWEKLESKTISMMVV